MTPPSPSIDKTILSHYNSHQIKFRRLPVYIIIVIVYVATVNSVYSQNSKVDCLLKLELPFTASSSNCSEDGGDWGGFLNNNCCVQVFDDYLYGLARRANESGNIYLNSTEQKNCLTLMKSINEGVLGCGIEKLTSGQGGCSDYSVSDVGNKLGNGLRSLSESCKVGGNCSSCLADWKMISASWNSSSDSMKVEADICRFSVLVSLTSKKIDDQNWLQGIYKCLENESQTTEVNQSAVAKKYSSEVTWILVGVLAALIVLLAIGFWVVPTRRNKRDLKKGKSSISRSSKHSESEESNDLEIPVKEIYAATENLSATNYIGQGMAGKVYKGVLSNGQYVAIKHIHNDEFVETFMREVTSLSHVKHPNLVSLVGYCKTEEECFLVYELCHNGNLSEWLFGKDKALSWVQRLEIAIDSARGLWFLHTYPEGCIVHRDIKPTNILLSANNQAKLSDFGLSKVMDIDQSFVSSEVRGTFGYVDPEYQKNHHVNASGDVYSFGIVLLQLLSGRRVINLNLKKPMPLDKMAKYLTRGGNITEFADPKLDGEYSVEAFDQLLKLALSCSGIKQQRPSMEQVVSRLEDALDLSTKEYIVPNSTPHEISNSQKNHYS